MKSLEALPAADVYVMETQGNRNPLNQGFLNISVELRCLEAMMYALLRSKGAFVHSLNAKLVAQYFSTSAKTSATKKRNAVKLVGEVTEEQLRTPLGEKAKFSEESLQFFRTRKKKDDLSDCLLQGLALLDWSHMCQRLDIL